MAVSSQVARVELISKNIIPEKIHRELKFFHNKNKTAQLALFFSQLNTFLQSGISLISAITSMRKQCIHAIMSIILEEISTSISKGRSLSSILKKYPHYFNNTCISCIETAEKTGTLEKACQQLASHYNNKLKLISQIKSQLTYPIITFIVAVIIGFILLTFVIPKFEEIFNEFNTQLPAFTKVVLMFSHFIQHSLYLIIILLVLAYIAFKQAKRKSIKFLSMIDKVNLQIPIFGNLVKDIQLANAFIIIATCYQTGIPLLEAIYQASHGCSNTVIKSCFLNVYQDCAKGKAFSYSLSKNSMLPELITSLVQTGEQSGQLETCFKLINTQLEQTVNSRINSLASLSEPFIIALLAVMIGSIVIAMYLPILQLGRLF